MTHENSPQKQRIEAIQEMIEKFLIPSNPDIKFTIQKLSWQPKALIKVSRSLPLFLRFRIRSFRSWFGYGSFSSFIRAFLFETRLFLQGKSIVQKPRHLVYVTVVLSQKHVRAWETIMDLDFDAALVLEDDAILDVNNISVLNDSLELINSSQPLFFNLAKGNDLSSYISKDFNSGNGLIKWSQAPIADTTCAYLFNESCAEVLLNAYRMNPKYDSLGIDFILSDIFILNTNITVLHNTNPPFANGTIFGEFESQTGATIRKRF